MTSSSLSPSPIFSLCKAGFKRNRVPALVLQLFAALILGLYFYAPGLRPAFDQIGAFKQHYGVWFSILSTIFFGGIIPWAVMIHRRRIPQGQRFKQLLFFVGYWALQGFMIDNLYSQQTQWFGSANDAKTLLTKVLIDQVPYNLIWATPNALFLYGWKNAEFSWRRFRESHPFPILMQKFATIQISAWIVWVPAVLMIYSLPANLQIPLFNLVLCFFSLVLAFVSRD
jgi:hypothetical protein